MQQYLNATRDFCTDPVTGDRRLIDYIMLGTMIVAAPILAPLYYLGLLDTVVHLHE